MMNALKLAFIVGTALGGAVGIAATLTTQGVVGLFRRKAVDNPTTPPPSAGPLPGGEVTKR